jgi:hypothetical protein
MWSIELKIVVSKLKNDSVLLRQVLNNGESSEVLSSLSPLERQAILETFSSSATKIGPLSTWV